MAPKIESKSLQNPFGNEVEILVKLNVDFEPNLEANLGPKLASKTEKIAYLRGSGFRDPNMTAT